MEDYTAYGYPKTPEVAAVVEEIARRFQPERIYLYNHKRNPKGDTLSFKLCVISNFGDKAAAERNIYLDIDCEVPFDVILYTPGEWESLCGKKDSFARKIDLTGMVVYG